MTTATPVTGHDPGTPEWSRKMSGSKVAAALGISPWTSPFTLWHQLAGNVPSDPDNEVLEFGRDAEPMMRAWFTRHTGITVNPSTTYAVDDWLVVTPDGECDCGGLLEIKTATDEWEWRHYPDDTSDDWERALPPHYDVQVQVQLGALGRDHAHIAVLFKNGCARETFRVDADPDLYAYLLHEARAFYDTVQSGTQPPIDASTSTFRALRHQHTTITGDDVECDPWLAWSICEAKAELQRAEHAVQRAKNQALACMGDARRLTTNGRWVARRQPTKTSTSLYLNTHPTTKEK